MQVKVCACTGVCTHTYAIRGISGSVAGTGGHTSTRLLGLGYYAHSACGGAGPRGRAIRTGANLEEHPALGFFARRRKKETSSHTAFNALRSPRKVIRNSFKIHRGQP